MNVVIKTYRLQNVEVQQNGIVRNEKGRLIGRLVNDIEFEGEHIKGVASDSPTTEPAKDTGWGLGKYERKTYEGIFLDGVFVPVKTAEFIAAQAIETARKEARGTNWCICTDFLDKGGKVVLDGFRTKRLALQVRQLLEDKHSGKTYAIDQALNELGEG